MRTAAAVLAATFVLALTGCGGSDSERPANASPTPTPDRPALAY